MSTKGYTTADPNDVRMLKPFPPPDTPSGAMHMPYSTNQNIGDSNGADIMEALHRIYNNRWPDSKREEHKAAGGRFAGPGTSFPIETAQDVKSAAKLYGHGANPDQIKSNIKRIAKDLGLTKYLPKEWKESDDDQDEDDGDDDDYQQAIAHIQAKSQVQEGHDQIRHLCRIVEAVQSDGPGHEVKVTVLQGGKSANGYSYDPLALQTVAQMIENAQAYADHGPPDQAVRSVRDLVGWYHDAQYIPPSAGQSGRVDAILHIVEGADWLWNIIQESLALGNHGLIGLSIDIFGQYQFNAALGAKEVTRVVSMNSSDIVTRPSAGGSFQRILHHQDQRKGDTSRMDPKDKDKNGTTATQDPPAEQNNNQQQPPAQKQETTQASAEQIKEAIAQNNQVLARMQELDQQKAKMAELENKLKLGESQLMLKQCLAESILPKAAKEQVEAKFKDRIFEAQELQGELTSMLDMMAKLTKDGVVRGHGFDKEAVTSGQITEAERVAAAFDLMFDLEIDGKFGKLPRFTGIREAYEVVTNGHNAFAGLTGYTKLGNMRVSEAAPIGWVENAGRIQEADTTTASFAYLLGTSMNKRLLKDYQAWPAEWQKFCTIAPIRDFKQQTRVRFGHFGSLPIVAEDTAYTTATLQDGAATYVPQKRGELVTVTRETIINDDLQAVKQIPTKLAKAAAYTLAEFVYAFLTTNPTIYDGTALFAAGHGNNNGSSLLSSAAMQTGVITMRKQQDFAGKVIGIRPRFLIVPPDNEFNAMIITNSAGVPGSNNNDINPMMGYTVPIVTPQITNTTAWYLAADPREIDTIEIGFVGGQVNPALFIQDQPLFGLNFTQDIISYKIRHEYGGTVVDFRGLYQGHS